MEDLFRGLTAGEPSAQEAFWRAQQPEIRRICRSILADQAEADEIADGVLVDFLFRHVAKIQHAKAMAAYLRLMAARRAIHRKQRRREFPAELDHHTESATAEQSAERALLLARLDECAEILTPKARTVLRLRHLGDLTNERIGQLVGGSKQYIGKLLSKSHERLKECLAMKRRERRAQQGAQPHG